MITIHFNNTTLDVQESDSSYRYRSLMSKPQLVLKFSLSEFVEIPVGAWCEYQGVKYKLGSPEDIKKNGTRNIEYTLTLGTLEDNMSLYKMRNPVDKRLKWSMCAKPHELVEAIVWNLNQRDEAGVWKVGECLDAAEQTVEFNHTYVDAALQDVANKFETEWEINDYTISLHKVEYFKDDPLPLAYGKGNGFEPGVGRTTQSDELPIKRLYVQGGNRNIDRSKYGSAELLLPKSQTLVYEGRTYQSDAEGYSIERIDKVSDAVKEDSLDCSEIYPSREGTVSAVECIDAGKNFYDIIDNSIPAELNFNDYVIEGETATISFQKGMLAGNDKQFEFKYNHSERRFELVPQEIDGVTMPNETFKPAVGDTYAIFGIMLPDAYICNNTDKTGASWDMFREAARKLYENEDPKFTFTGTLQGLWAKKNWLRVGGRLKVGGYVLFTDEQFVPDSIAIRITGIKEYLTSPYAPVLEISNSVSGKSVSSQLREIGQNEVATDNSIRNAVSYTKRRFRDVRETMAMLEDSLLDNFTNSINPLTVQTMMMLVGDESLQFRFVASKTDLTAISDGITYDNAAKQLHIPHGFIQHMTLGIGTISSSHVDSEYKVWEMNEYLSPYLDNGEKKYYLYAKVSRTNTAAKGDFLLSDRAIKMTDIAGYYHLLVGILNSEYDGERSYVSLYGFSEILPGRITTDKIVSSDGKTSFDLLQGIISGHITFQSGSSGLENLAEWSGKQQQIDNAQQIGQEAQSAAQSADRKAQQAKDYIDNTLPGELSEINKRLDGVVENWFYPYTPSLYNEPAQTWIADGEQENHIGDTFTNTLPANFDPTDAGCWEQGSIGASYIDGIKTWDQIKIADSTRIRLKTPVGGIPKGAVLSVGEGYTMGYNPIASSGAVIASYVWSQSYTVGSDNPYIAFVIRKTDNAKITPAEYPQIHFTISSDKTTNPDAGKSWRWVKEEDGTYKWTLIADSDAVKALQEAARAQDTADAKRRVFVVTPTTPYDVGDIWTQGEGGDIMRCIESRATGNFESSDWDKASKYTDDTAANEAKERLAAMSSDGTLSKEEKPAVRQQWSQIQKEYAKYQTDATSFGVSITALKGAYDALAAYLSSIGLTSDTDTTIVPDTFNQKFADYYAEVSRFSNLVAQKQADEAVDNLQVGARNYIAKQFLYAWNSAKEGVSDVVTTGTDTDGAYMRIDANKASNAGVATPLADGITSFEDCFGGKIAYKSGMSYVFKARIKQPNSKRGVMFCAVYDDNTFQFMATPPSPTASELYEAVYTTQAGKSLQKIVLYVVTWNPIYLYDVQLTEGNKAPAGYLVAEEDIKFGARNYIAKQFIREWNNVKEGVTDVVTSGADADGTYLYVNWGKLLQAGLAATNLSQVSTVPDCFGGQIKYKPNTPYVFKARIKQGAEITFRIAYEDGTKEVLSAPPAGTEGVYEVVHAIDASRVVQKIYLYVGKGVSMYLYEIQLTEGNKAPTGYIIAEEDVQAQIEQVKMDVDYIASDSSLTPSDKQQVANEWARIQGEYWSIMANAEKYDVPTDSFTVYFQALEDYLTPLLADMSTTSEIVGTEFRKVFSDYYEISSNMSDLIDDAIDESIKSTEYLKQAMEDGSTEVKGGLIMTNVMLMKNQQGEVTAGVSGLQEDDVPFWSGADYTNRKKAVFRVHADGEVHATKGTVGILQVKNDSVEVSDATASGDKIILTPYRITSVSQVLGASSVPGVVETEEVSALATGQSNPFVRNVYESSPPFTCGQGVHMSARITGRITGNAEGGGGGVKIEVVNALTGKADPLYRNSTAEAQNTNLNIDETISYRFTGAARKYYIRITVEASASGKLTASATVNAAQFNFVKDIRKNLIAPNGVAVVKGSSNYAVFTGDIFEVLIGKAGLRIQNGYVYKRDTDHTTWTKI